MKPFVLNQPELGYKLYKKKSKKTIHNIFSSGFLILLTFSLSSQSWTQMGANIEGIESYCNFGYSIALSDDGNTIISGGNALDQNEEDSGYAQVYEWNGSSWQQKGDNIYGEEFEDEFGYSADISADGDIIAIGATQGGNETQVGYVKVFAWNGSSWEMKGSRLNGENEGDHFGTSISLSDNGNSLAVYDRQGINGEYSGTVVVYNWNGTEWIQKGANLEGNEGDNFGWAIDLSYDGNTLAVGAESGYSFYGYARIYLWNGSEWDQKGNDIYGDAEGDKFGFSISIDNNGNSVAIGARNNSGNGMQSGQLKVFSWNNNQWEQKGNDIYGDGITNFLGWSTSLNSDGNIVAVSYTPFSSKGYDEGHLRVFQWNNTSWEQIGEDLNGNVDGDRAGYDSAINSDGSVVAFSAPFGHGNINRPGYVRIFSSTYTGTEDFSSQYKTLIFPNPTTQHVTIKTEQEQLNIVLKDILGKTVARYSLKNTLEAEIEIPGPKGIYFLELRTDIGSAEIVKVVKN